MNGRIRSLSYKLLLRFLPLSYWISFRAQAIAERLDMINKLMMMPKTPSDIFIISYPKSGTTWLQMILYQLTTSGDLDEISHIFEYSPQIEASPFEKLNNFNSTHRRVMKTHVSHHHWPKNRVGKHVYIMRDAIDVAASYYHFDMNTPQNGGHVQLSFDEYFGRFMKGRVALTGASGQGSWFEHVSSWKKEEGSSDFLFVRYEDLRGNLEKEVRRIAAFSEIEIDEDEMPRILHKCSFEYMKSNSEKLSFNKYVQKDLMAFAEKAGAAEFFRKGESNYSERGQISEEKLNEYHQLRLQYNV